MELHQIRAFVTVARVGNVTKAADVLCVTQPAVTGQIKGLESSLGVALFDRGGGRMSLTRAGEKLLPQAETLLAAASELRGLARSMQGELSGRLDLGLPGETSDFLRTGALALAVQRDLPLVELHTHTQAVGQLLDQVRGGALSGAFAIAAHPPRNLHWLALRSVSYRIAFPTRLAGEMQRGGWRVLAGLPWVDGVADSHVHLMLRQLFEQQGLAPNVVVRSEDTSALETFVRAGSACALLREEVALAGVERGDWVVWGHARVDARLYFCSAVERVGDPLVVALSSAVQSVWA
ncbi:LysR family transcriptional regulator [Roseateles sp. DAIF2]|uniref:LysR family transcriptional regulator n=1 Tax=Roseateles sp. DAIF2 TaxID=2714952 RepID=UPI0018A25975|nr:LysR family transcriptional regulator [Roseateles sp. DAIF2]QPF71766.1 LysR family transcriptional regulator [Roseateles sp. DAIF2]